MAPGVGLEPTTCGLTDHRNLSNGSAEAVEAHCFLGWCSGGRFVSVPCGEVRASIVHRERRTGRSAKRGLQAAVRECHPRGCLRGCLLEGHSGGYRIEGTQADNLRDAVERGRRNAGIERLDPVERAEQTLEERSERLRRYGNADWFEGWDNDHDIETE